MQDDEKSRRLRLYLTAGLLVLLLGCCYWVYWINRPVPVPPPKEEEWPSWSPDSRQVVYECYLDGPIVGGDVDFFSSVNEPNSDLSFFTEEAADLCITDLATHKRVRLTSEEGGDQHPSWTPDGTQIAYLRADGIYLISTKGKDRRRLVQIDSPLVTTHPTRIGVAKIEHLATIEL